MTPDRTAAAIQARRASTDTMLERVKKTLHQMRRENTSITVAAIARRADVSRTFLYQNAAAHQLIGDIAAQTRTARIEAQVQREAENQHNWRDRALNAEDNLAAANREIYRQRSTIADLLGKIRDLEADLPEGSVQQLLTEKAAMKRQLQELNDELRRNHDRLQAARDNNRFLDARIADLEAKLLNTQ